MYLRLLLLVLAAIVAAAADNVAPLRIVGVGLPYMGQLQVLHSGEWRGICSANWTNTDAAVACRQLGFPRGGVASLLYSGLISGAAKAMWLNSVSCTGNETALSDCPSTGWNVNNATCSPEFEVAGVNCAREPPVYNSSGPSGNSSALRLANGTINAGRLEVNIQGQWLGLCTNNMLMQSLQAVADLACKQMGFTAGGYLDSFLAEIDELEPYTNGQLTGYIWAWEPHCFFNNGTTPEGCGFWDIQSNCSNFPNAPPEPTVAVRCMATAQQLAPADPENSPPGGVAPLRLLQGGNYSSQSSGRLQVQYQGSWGDVCSTSEQTSIKVSSQAVAADVACRQLGYSAGASSFSTFYDPSIPVVARWVNLPSCNGSEAALTQCAFAGWGNSAACTGITYVQCDDGDDGPNVPLIVGLTVGLGVPFLITVVVLLWLAARKRPADMENPRAAAYGVPEGTQAAKTSAPVATEP